MPSSDSDAAAEGGGGGGKAVSLAEHPVPAFAIITGDMAAHKLCTDAAAPLTSITPCKAGVSSGALKLQAVAEATAVVRKHLRFDVSPTASPPQPSTTLAIPVFPTFGNNDMAINYLPPLPVKEGDSVPWYFTLSASLTVRLAVRLTASMVLYAVTRVISACPAFFPPPRTDSSLLSQLRYLMNHHHRYVAVRSLWEPLITCADCAYRSGSGSGSSSSSSSSSTVAEVDMEEFDTSGFYRYVSPV
jgi:hypothetical protein